MERIGGNPNTILKPWVSDIRVQADGEYLLNCGSEANRNLNTDNTSVGAVRRLLESD